MSNIVLIAVAVLMAVMMVAFWLLKRRQTYLYGLLRDKCERILASYNPFTFLPALDDLPNFEHYYAVIGQLLSPESFARLREQVLGLSDQMGENADKEPNYIPTHKKGATIAYQTLIEKAPEIVAFYRSKELSELISKIVGAQVIPTPIHDQSSCSILIYERPGDHIEWHYDHNFYNGRHFTVLVPLLNLGHQPDGLSAARYSLKDEHGNDKTIPTPANSLVMHEGAKVLHKASRLEEGERRILLSMTFTTDPSSNLIKGTIRRFKDIAFFGPRALWT